MIVDFTGVTETIIDGDAEYCRLCSWSEQIDLNRAQVAKLVPILQQWLASTQDAQTPAAG